jgi:hypothetical protein
VGQFPLHARSGISQSDSYLPLLEIFFKNKP